MSDVICVSNRNLCNEDFLVRIESIAKEHPKAILLREKDLSERSYHALAKDVLQICDKYGTPCILHSFVNVAKELKWYAIHLPFASLQSLNETDKKQFTILGASCHSVEEAVMAEQMGCTYIIVGHIFSTDCKKGLEPRGLSFLEEICKRVSISVYAIGGINAQNVQEVRKAGALGVCMMSGLMTCESPKDFFEKACRR